ncbi:hypothetical protein ECNE1487_2024, partial [Escherichia coli NE1487]
MSPGSSFYCAG